MTIAQASKRLTAAIKAERIADIEFSKAQQEWCRAIATYAKTEVRDLEFSNVVCSKNRHGGHIYKCESDLNQRHGHGNWRCVLCGIDDWSE